MSARLTFVLAASPYSGQTAATVLKLAAAALESGHAPVIFATARDRDDDIARALQAGADDYIAKPVRQGELLARIEAVARARARSRAGSFRAACVRTAAPMCSPTISTPTPAGARSG